jgi:hypothetical protein
MGHIHRHTAFKRPSKCCIILWTVVITLCVLMRLTVPQGAVLIEAGPAFSANHSCGLHNSYVKFANAYLGNTNRPTLTQQYARGLRTFELDVHFVFGRWIVAHAPWIDQSSHVATLREGLCTLASLQRPGDGLLVAFVEIKTFLVYCTKDAMRAFANDVRACASDMEVWVDSTSYLDLQRCEELYPEQHRSAVYFGHTDITVLDHHSVIDWWSWGDLDNPKHFGLRDLDLHRRTIYECDDSQHCVRFARAHNATAIQVDTIDTLAFSAPGACKSLLDNKTIDVYTCWYREYYEGH